MRHQDDGLAKGQFGGVRRKVAYKGLINFHEVDVKFLQIRQGRIARAEVVQRHTNARVGQFNQVLGNMLVAGQQQPFGDLYRQAFAWQTQQRQLIHP